MKLRRATSVDLTAVVALQQLAYARNRVLLGVEPLPLLADYAEIFRTMEIWLAGARGGLGDTIEGVLILEPHADHMLIWSVSTAPEAQSKGLGRELLAAAETRARELRLTKMRLYTGAILEHLVDWYGRHGYTVERIEQMPDRQVAHMVKSL